MSTNYLDKDRLRDARQKHAEAMINEAKVLARRSESPEDRAALAELEAVLCQARDQWLATAA